MIEQITVFLENEKGRIAALCRTLGDANINMAALSVADTTEYGIVRIICGNTAAALAALDAGGYRAIKTEVMAIAVPHHPGGAADLLEKLDGLPVGRKYTLGYAREAVRALIGDFYIRQKGYSLAQLDEALPCESMSMNCLLTENCSLRDSRVDLYLKEAGELDE